MFFSFFHRNWDKATGRVLDSRIHSARNDNVRFAYIVQFAGADGQKTKLEVLEDSHTLGVAVGATVPLLVSPDGKKAVFDRNDPQINAAETIKRNKKADEERFRKQLEN